MFIMYSNRPAADDEKFFFFAVLQSSIFVAQSIPSYDFEQ